MLPNEIDKRIIEQHNVTVQAQDNYMYPWITTCICGYQAACRSQEEGDYYRNSHLNAHRSLLATNYIPQGHL